MFDLLTSLLARARSIFYDNTNSGLLADNVNDAIDEIALSSGGQPFTTLSDPATDSITTNMIDTKGGVVITLTAAGNSQTLPAPTDTSVAHKFVIINNDTSTDNINIIGAVTITVQPGEKVEVVYDSTAWIASEAEGYWLDDGTSLKAQNSTRNIDLQSSRGINIDALDFITNPTSGDQQARIKWNNQEYTLDIHTGLGPVLQIGQEQYILIYNDTGSLLPNGTLMRPKAAFPVGSLNIPTFELAQANIFSKAEGTLAMTTSDIGIGQLGFVTRFGKVRGLNMSGFTNGEDLYLSDTVAGGYTKTRPEFPSYIITIGGVLNNDAVNGEIVVSVTNSIFSTFNDAWDGTIRETIRFEVSSDGATVTGTLTNQDSPSNDLTLVFSDGFSTFDATPGATVTLTAGSATVPQTNYVYIDKATKTLQKSTSDWPTTIEHVRIAEIALLTAARTQEDGALRNQNWNDEIKFVNDNGHILHIAERLRQESSKWQSGALVTAVAGAGNLNVYIENTAGIVYQLHRQSFPLLSTIPYTIDAVSQGSKTFTISDDGDLSSTFPDGRLIKVSASTGNDGIYTIASTNYSAPNFVITVEESIPDSTADGEIGDDLHVVNDFTTPYKTIKSLADITTDASGVALNNTSYSIVIWGVMNKSGQVSHLMSNAPVSSYNKNFPDQAVADAQNHSVYSIPKTFQGVGFLMARVTLVNNAGVYTIYDTEDLRGSIPNTTAGGGAGGTGVTEFTGLNDTPSSYTGEARNILKVNDAETGLEFLDPNATELVSKTASFTVTDADKGKLFIVNSASNITLTVPETSTEAIDVGSFWHVLNINAGDITIAKEGSDVLNGNTLVQQNAVAQITKRVAGSPNTYEVFGGTSIQTFTIEHHVDISGGDGTYYFSRPRFDGTIINMFGVLTTGTATLAANSTLISSSAVTHGALSLSTTPATVSVTANNTYDNSDKIEIVTSSSSSPGTLILTFECTGRL
jgi:hypothetical protein